MTLLHGIDIMPTEDFEAFIATHELYFSGGDLQGTLAVLGGLDILVSNQEHKKRAIAKGMGFMGIKRRLTRLPLSHIDEPNYIKQTSEMLRGKSDISMDMFAHDYHGLTHVLNWFKQLEAHCIIQDVRPKSGSSGSTLSALTNPPEDVITHRDLDIYVSSGFRHGNKPTTVRLENGFERSVLKGRGGDAVQWDYPYASVVAGSYYNYATNPLRTPEQRSYFFSLCSELEHNGKLKKNFKAAGGILNEILVLHALLNHIEVEAIVPQGIVDRTSEVSVVELLQSVYTPSLISRIKELLSIETGGGSTAWEKARNFATIAVAAHDFAIGGSFDAIGALYGQVRSNRSVSPSEAIDLKSAAVVAI
ncbi:hypothetical protein KBD75_03255 [Candidatus Woesebacteria bacterium]|nr:hypothetical protein [Candidatus Woesebacteria bacterium]